MVGGVDSRLIGLHMKDALTEESFTSLGFSMSWEEQFSLWLAPQDIKSSQNIEKGKKK